MYLVQLLLPTSDNHQQAFGRAAFDRVRDELTEHFGGMTAFRRSPAEGMWKEQRDEVTHDEIVVFEVMTDALDRKWWEWYRQELEQRFKQKELIVRASEVEQL